MKRNRLLYLLIALSLLSVLLTTFQRVQIESENKSVEIILDYKETLSLANQSNQDFEWWLKRFKELGATSVALEEETLESMVNDDKDLEVHLVANLKKDITWKDKYDKEFIDYISENSDRYDVIAITKSKDIYDFIITGLQNRYPKEFFSGIEGLENYYVTIDGEELDALYAQTEKIINFEGKAIAEKKELYSSKVARIGLGFDEEKINIIKNSGLKVLPRPINFNKYSAKLPNAFIEEISKYKIKPSTLIFAGKEVIGYPEGINDIIKYMKTNNINIGMVENSVQREHLDLEGMEDVVESLDYDAVRVFSIWPFIQERFKYYNYEGAEEIENTLYRAVTERNIRLIYFKPFKEEEFKYVTDITEYEKTFKSFEERIKRHGMILGEASTMRSYNIGALRHSIIGFGVVAAGLLLLTTMFPISSTITYILAALGMLFILGVNYVMPDLGDKVIALAASIIFPTLSVAYLIEYTKSKLILTKEENIFNIIKGSLFALVICTGISLIGALYVGASLSNIKYLLELDIFRGVKVSQLMPIVLFAILYVIKFGFDRDVETLVKNSNSNKKDFIELLEHNIKIKHLIMASVVAVAGYIFISRTGHETTVQPSDLEMIARNFLENVLLARPRTKEFLIAFPALMATVYMAFRGYKKLIFPLALATVIGLSSITNTFSHLRTPIYLSFIRTLYSIAFGAILGLIAIFIFSIIERLIHSFERSKS